jgi:hypothetical protein
MIIKTIKGKRAGYYCICKCDYCGKEFERPVSNLKKNQFCCREHYWKWLKKHRKGFKHSRESREKIRKSKIGNKNHRWKGGRIYTDKGYVLIYSPDHPNSVKGGYMFEHRLVAEKSMGRYLTGDELVHHKNGIRDDNRIENLEVLSFGEHIKKSQNKRSKLKND